MWNLVLRDSEWHDSFSPRNLPYGVCKPNASGSGTAFLATRVGNHVIKLQNLAGLNIPTEATNWEFLMKQNKAKRVEFRETMQRIVLGEDSPLHNDENFSKVCLPVENVTCLLPCTIGDYTDFYASRNHAENVGTMFRGKDNALQPNWLHLPVGYHGRASSVVPSPSTVTRPMGQKAPPASDNGEQKPTFGKCDKLDFELEVGVFVGGEENPLGTRLSVRQARDRIFGLVLLNDWSARDIQAWEYVPLGPFCAKNFCTTISPWIVPIEALEEFKAVPIGGIRQSEVLDYLKDDEYLLYDMDLFAAVLREGAKKEVVVTRTNLRNLYWTPAQMIAHHTVTGCNLRAGDLLGTGTISGHEAHSFGSLLELSWNGTRHVPNLDGKGKGSFLQDGDRVRMFGHCTKGIGFGDCLGVISPSKL